MSESLKLWLVDVAERTVATFVQSFLGLLLASLSDGFDVSTLRAAAVASLVAALAFTKGAVARRFGEPHSASLTA